MFVTPDLLMYYIISNPKMGIWNYFINDIYVEQSIESASQMSDVCIFNPVKWLISASFIYLTSKYFYNS